MALQGFVDAFNIGTGAVSSTVVRTGYGFQPKCCLYWWSGRTESVATFARKTLQAGFGMAVSSTSRASVTMMDEDTPNTMNCLTYQTDLNCIGSYTTGRVQDGLANLQSFDSDGQTLVITDQFVTNLRVHCLALGGTDLTHVALVQFQIPATAGTHDITSVGFQPTAVVFLTGPNASSPPAIQAGNASFALGAATAPAAQGVMLCNDTNAVGTSIAYRYGYGGECAGVQNTASSNYQRATLDSFLPNGFRLNWLENPGDWAAYIWALCLQGPSMKVDNFLTLTSAATMTETGLGFAPKALLLFSASAPQQSQDVPTAGSIIAVGAATSPTNRATQSCVANNAAGTAACASSTREDACLSLLNTATQSAGVVDIQTMGADGFTAVMDVADVTTQKYVTYLAFGDAPTTKAPPPRRQPWRYFRRRAV